MVSKGILFPQQSNNTAPLVSSYIVHAKYGLDTFDISDDLEF